MPGILFYVAAAAVVIGISTIILIANADKEESHSSGARQKSPRVLRPCDSCGENVSKRFIPCGCTPLCHLCIRDYMREGRMRCPRPECGEIFSNLEKI